MGAPDPVEINDKILVLFDGVCNLCNGAVQFIIKRDPNAKFRFASLQSDVGRSQLLRYKLSVASMRSIVLIENNVAYERSDAVFRIAQHLQGGWPALGAFKIVPRFIRDGVYNLIASSRYRLFGRQDSCMIPDESLKERFIG